MRRLLSLTLSILATSALAQNQDDGSKTKIMQKKSVIIPVNISSEDLHLSQADYSSPVVKVLVPGLADVTLLDHRNFREGAPCMATLDTRLPEDVIQGRPAVEKVKFTITESKITSVDTELNVCYVTLEEKIEAKIRGFNFNHVRVTALPDRDVADCR